MASNRQGGANRHEVTITGGLPDWNIRSRRMWAACYPIADLDIATPAVLMLLNGSNTDVLTTLDVGASAAVKVDLYESPAYSLIGTAVTVANLDRNSDATAKVKVYYTPTTAADGTLIWSHYTGTSRHDGPGVSGKLMLKANTVYLLRITATADNSVVAANLFFEDDLTGSAATSTTTTTTTTT